MGADALELLAESIETVRGGLAILDAAGSVLIANERYRKIYPLVAPWAGGDGDEGIVEIDGEECWIRINERPMRSGAMMRRLIETTEQKSREADLMTSQMRLREAVEALEEGFVLFDRYDQLVLCNGRYRTIFSAIADLIAPGATFEMLVRAVVARGWSIEQESRDEAWIAQRLAAHRAGSGVYEYLMSDGRWILARERKTADGGCVVTFADITERKAAAERQRQSQKLEALGYLAGGVAHEFNNLLTAIGGFAKMALRRLGQADYVRECLDDIIASSDRAAHLTRQLLAFGRKQPLDAEIVRAADIVRGLDRMLRTLVPETIELVLDIADDDAAIAVDPNEVSQAVLNLAINARDAMPYGGRLVVGTGIVTAPARPATVEKGLAGVRCASIFVRDTGSGMSGAVLAHIFEPFFTTKEQGKGTGLGLPAVLSIVERSGGAVDVETEAGRGTIFSILLPLATGAPEALRTQPHRNVLIVIAEPELRNLAYAALTEHGFQCARAAERDEALAILARTGAPPDLLLASSAVPDKRPDLAAELMVRFPLLKFLCVAASARAPFTAEQLVADVRAALDAAGPVFLEAS
ncbi:MAG TPA: PAS-domain containing protein [Stellaceae bacterium]|nr:PAS-domain containing protein [Stellaceae bacterium]